MAQVTGSCNDDSYDTFWSTGTSGLYVMIMS